jgi:hypothetical protein
MLSLHLWLVFVLGFVYFDGHLIIISCEIMGKYQNHNILLMIFLSDMYLTKHKEKDVCLNAVLTI